MFISIVQFTVRLILISATWRVTDINMQTTVLLSTGRCGWISAGLVLWLRYIGLYHKWKQK